MNKQTVLVSLKENPYPINIGENLLDDKKLLTQHIVAKQILIISNETIAPLYLGKIKKSLREFSCDEILLPDGEAHKNITQWLRILDALANHHHHRDTTLIALGGGVIGDIAGFAAACYQRGVAIIQIPTTLLAQVDASIGGKTAVNHPVGKNLIGAFHQPRAVIIDIQTLKTLPQREFNSGIAEIIKMALICDAAFFEWLEKNMAKLLSHDKATLIHAIQRACEIKRDIVIVDEKETTGERALLNLGHTFAHAIEQVLGYGQWLHGEAVAVGLVLAAKMSQEQGLLSREAVQRISRLLKQIPLPTELPNGLTFESLLSTIQMDKKIKAGKLRWVLLKSIGEAMLVTL